MHFSFFGKIISEVIKMNDCLFCKIVNGEIPSKKLYEDDEVLVFLDINPSTNGDCLVIPKRHVVTIDDLDNDLITQMYEVILKMKQLLEEKLGCSGLTIVQNNGYGQEVKHFHIHLTPRYENDLLEHKFNRNILMPLDEIYQKLSN